MREKSLQPWQLLRCRLGWKDCCCHWLWLVLLAISRMLCSVAVYGVNSPTLSDLHRKKNQAWKEVALHSPPSAKLAGPAGAAQEEHLLLNASAVGQHHATFAACARLYIRSLRDSSS